MAQADVAEPVIDEIMGHEGKGMGARYTKGFTIEQLKDAVDAIFPPVDLTWLVQPQEPVEL
ncbi:MAG: hypothetical protein R3E03_09165 [Novosphingobium sp.]